MVKNKIRFFWLAAILVTSMLLGIPLTQAHADERGSQQGSISTGPYLTEAEAKCFIGFLFNTNELTDEQLATNDMFKLMTGQLSGEAEIQAGFQFASFMDAQLSHTTSSLGSVTDKTSDLLVKYLSTKAEGDLATNIVNETFHGIIGRFQNYVYNEYLLSGGDLQDMQYEHFMDTMLGWDTINSIIDIPSKVEEYSNRIVALNSAVFFAASSNREEMFKYFQMYRNNLYVKYTIGEEEFKLIMEANELCNEKLVLIKMLEPTLANFPFLDDKMLLWATDDRIALMERWADFSYLLEQRLCKAITASESEELKLTQDTEVWGALIVKKGISNPDGHNLIVHGDLIIEKGSLASSGGRITVFGDFRHSSYSSQTYLTGDASIFVYGNADIYSIAFYDQARCIIQGSGEFEYIYAMESNANLLRVEGDFEAGHHGMTDSSKPLRAGTVEVCGDMFLRGNTEYPREWCGYHSEGTHKTVFCGDRLQTIKGGGGYCRLRNVEFRNPQITFDATWTDYQASPLRLMDDATITYNGYIACASLDLNGHSLTMPGTIYSYYGISVKAREKLSIGSFGIEFSGTSVRDIHVSNGGVLTVTGKIDSYDTDLSNGGALNIFDPDARIRYISFSNGGYLYADGNLNITNLQKMNSEKDLMHVSGDLYVDGSLFDTSMTAGTVELEGNFSRNNPSTNGYLCKGSCKTVFCGEGVQKVMQSARVGNVVNAHSIESDLNIADYSRSRYVWDPEYQRGDRYVQFATLKGGQSYSGSAVTPDLVYGSIDLTEGADYLITGIADNTNVGTARVSLKGAGAYKGTLDLPFIISSADMSQVSCVQIPEQTYTGRPVEPKPELSFNGCTLVEGVDYALSFSNNTEPGDAFVTITGKGNYSGMIELPFQVKRKGWYDMDGKTCYYRDGALLTGEQQIEGSRYYFKKTGALIRGAWLDLPDGRAWCGADGAFSTGQQIIGSKKYLFDERGRQRTGFAAIGGSTYYYHPDGGFAAGERWIDGRGYYFKKTGALVRNAWLDLSDGTVRAGADGAFLAGFQTVEGRMCLFDERGRSTEGFVAVGSSTCYVRDGILLTGEQKVGGKTYYFKKTGALVRNAWLDLSDGTVRAGADGAFLTGEQTIAGEPFSFDDRGRLLQAEASEAPLPPSDPVTEEAAPVVEMPEPGVGEAVASPAEQTLAEGPAADVEDVEEARLSLALLDAVTGERLEGKSYTHPELEALASDGAEPVSVLCEREDGTYEARTAAAYVTLEALLADAGLQGAWREGAVLLVDGGEGEEAYAFEELSREGWFYPSATADALVPDGGRAVAPVLCFAYTESPILTTAEDSEGDNISCAPIESPFFVMIGLPD